jgi:hypothetical protein
MQERRSQLPAHLDLPILIPHNNLMQQPRAHHHRHSNHLPQLLLPLSLVPRGQQGQPHVLISPVVDGVLVLSAGCVAYLFRTQTVNHRDAVTTLPSATGTTSRHVLTIKGFRMMEFFRTSVKLEDAKSERLAVIRKMY